MKYRNISLTLSGTERPGRTIIGRCKGAILACSKKQSSSRIKFPARAQLSLDSIGNTESNVNLLH